MAGHVVRSPDGRTWRVRRAWVPRLGAGDTLWRRFRRRFSGTKDKIGESADPDSGCLEVFTEGVLVGLALIALFLLFAFVVVPLLVALVDLLLLVVVAVLATLARVLLGRPWRIEAVADDGTLHTWDVVGWDASRAKIDEVAAALASGIVPPADAA
jgi:hypothetical protein